MTHDEVKLTPPQVPWRHALGRARLAVAFEAKRIQIAEERRIARENAARKLQISWRKSKGRYAEYVAAQARLELERERLRREAAERRRILENNSAQTIQRLHRWKQSRENLARLVSRRGELMNRERMTTLRHKATWTIQAAWRRMLGRTGFEKRTRARAVEQAAETRDRTASNAATTITRAARRQREQGNLGALFARRRIMLVAQADWHTRTSAASRIQLGWRESMWRYNRPLRIGARLQAAGKVAKERRRRRAALEKKSARIIETGWCKHRDYRRLQARFRERKRLLEAARIRVVQDAAAKLIGFAYRRYADRRELARRLERRAEAIRRRKIWEEKCRQAGLIQRCYRKYKDRQMLWRKFEARAMELQAQRLQQQRVIEAKIAAQHARDAQDVARVALKQMEFSGWKMGSDQFGQNYYYNVITGETSWTKPEGWVPPEDEVWVKNVTDKGLTFYFNQISGETAWFPPCDSCREMEGKKICFDCSLTLCNSCFARIHAEEGKEEHRWRAADQEKEELEQGEQHCVHCETRKAERTSTLGRDSYCVECWNEIFSHGWLKTVEWIPYWEFKKGWQAVSSRNPKDPPYYFNPKTGEETYDKPLELMLPEERAEHQKFQEFKTASEKYVKQIEKLQHDKEALEYEKDMRFFEEEKQKSLEKQELETLRELVAVKEENNVKADWATIAANPVRYYLNKKRRQKREVQLYRKQLLLSKKQRAQQAAEDAMKREEGQQAK